MWALSFVGSVHRVSSFDRVAARSAVGGVGSGVICFSMEAATYPASGFLFALVGIVVESPTVATMGYWWVVLECPNRAVSTIGDKEFLT